MDYDKLLNISVELGCQLMSSGAEIYRVEESVRRLLQAYGLESPEVFAIPNCVIVSVTTPEGHPITRMRRIGSHGTNIELLERCNALCRQLCTQPPSVDKAQELLSATVKGSPKYATWQVLMICLLYGSRFIGSNSFFRTAFCSALASLLSLALVQIGLGNSLDTVTIGTLMVLVPGMALTNAMREIMAGDIISGLSRAAESILTAAAIAIGSALGLGLVEML